MNSPSRLLPVHIYLHKCYSSEGGLVLFMSPLILSFYFISFQNQFLNSGSYISCLYQVSFNHTENLLNFFQHETSCPLTPIRWSSDHIKQKTRELLVSEGSKCTGSYSWIDKSRQILQSEKAGKNKALCETLELNATRQQWKCPTAAAWQNLRASDPIQPPGVIILPLLRIHRGWSSKL